MHRYQRQAARLQVLASSLARYVSDRDKGYKSSWRKRGGRGAYYTIARKPDRIEDMVEKHGGDIFAAITNDQRPDSIINDILDLAGYMMLVIEYLLEEGIIGDDELQKLLEAPGIHFKECYIRTVPRTGATIEQTAIEKELGLARRVDRTGQENPRGFDPKEDCSQ